MAVLLAANDLVQVRIVCYAVNQIGVNILHYTCSNIVGSPDLTLLASKIDTAIAPAFKACMSQNAKYRGNGVRRLNPNPTIEYYNTTSDGAGTSAADMLPLAVSGIMAKITGQPGRAFRGRVYMPFPSEAFNDASGNPSSTYNTQLLALSGLLGGTHTYTTSIGNTVDLTLVLKHRVGFVTVPVTILLPRTKWGTQHRRGDYGRPNVLPF